MMKHVNTVLVGKTVTKTYAGTETVDGFSAGEVFLVDQDGNLINTEAKAIAATAIKFALKTAETRTTDTGATVSVIKYSNPIDKKGIKDYKTNNYAAATEDQITVNFGSFAPIVGNRYVLRLVFIDLYEHPGQYTHTFEAIATSTSLYDLITEFARVINKRPGTRVVASTTGGTKATATVGGIVYSAVNKGTAGNSITVEQKAAGTAAVTVTGNAISITPATGALTLAAIQAQIAANASAAALITADSGTSSGNAAGPTSLATGTNDNTLVLSAKVKTDNDGSESINEYSQVSMLAYAYYTNPSATGFASKNKYPMIGVTVNKTATANPGHGNPKIVRDREKWALSYKGITNRTWFPVIKPNITADLTAHYDEFIVEHNNKYLSPDNQFEKEAMLATEVYVPVAGSDHFGGSDVYNFFVNFVTGA